MPAPTALAPAAAVPDLALPLSGGGEWSSQTSLGDDFTLAVFYRGYHCPKCRDQLQELEGALDGLAEAKTGVVAISMDPQERADATVSEWETGGVPIAYGLSEEQARAWGLHMSTSRGKTSIGVEELKVFNEPGIFLIRSDGTLYASWVQTIPMARPPVKDIIGLINFATSKGYPPRGTKLD